VSAALKGLMAGICAVIVDAVAEMAISALRVKRVLSAFIMAGAFLLGFMGVNVLLILAGGGAAGVAYQLLSRSSPNAGGGQPL
jgi:chromate transporter